MTISEQIALAEILSVGRSYVDPYCKYLIVVIFTATAVNVLVWRVSCPYSLNGPGNIESLCFQLISS